MSDYNTSLYYNCKCDADSNDADDDGDDDGGSVWLVGDHQLS